MYAGHNIVVVARNFNPTIFSQLWLVNQAIFSEKELAENYIFTPIAVNLNTPDFAFLAVPDKIQLSFPSDKVDFKALSNRIFGGIIKKLPHTPYQAIGFNLSWILFPQNPDKFVEISRKIFVSPSNPIARHFTSTGSRFGTYLSKDVPMGRLRLDIKPVSATPPPSGEQKEGLHLTFNFTLDLKEGGKDLQILRFFDQWDAAHAIASEMTTEMGLGWSN